MKVYNYLDLMVIAGVYDELKGKYTKTVVNYLAKKCNAFNVDYYRIGNVAMVITHDATYIECCECGQRMMVYSRYRLEDSYEYAYNSGRGNAAYYDMGYIEIGMDENRKLTAICGGCRSRCGLRSCEVCGNFSQLPTTRPLWHLDVMTYNRYYSINERTAHIIVNPQVDHASEEFTWLCPSCVAKYADGIDEHGTLYRRCDRCDVIYPHDELTYSDDDSDHYMYCEECCSEVNEEYHSNDCDDYSQEENEGEWEDLNGVFINEYHGANHAPVNCGDQEMLGAEYEILCFDNDKLVTYDDRRSFCSKLSKYGAITKDSSVDLEIVTDPLKLENLRHNILEIAKICREKCVKAWSDNKCGLHFHLNRRGLSNFPNIYHFLKENSDNLFKLSGRTHSNTGYCEFNFPHKEDELLESCDNYGRYLAINLQNSHTVEFRFFRNTTNEVRLNGYFDFLKALLAHQEELKDYTWEMLIKDTKNNFLMEMFEVNSEAVDPILEVA